MDISSLQRISSLQNVSSGEISKAAEPLGKLNTSGLTADGTMFDSILNTAIENINTTNNYLSNAENEKIKWALGETENTHDLIIALQKASTALQYTVAIRDKVVESYKEIMQIQI